MDCSCHAGRMPFARNPAQPGQSLAAAGHADRGHGCHSWLCDTPCMEGGVEPPFSTHECHDGVNFSSKAAWHRLLHPTCVQTLAAPLELGTLARAAGGSQLCTCAGQPESKPVRPRRSCRSSAYGSSVIPTTGQRLSRRLAPISTSSAHCAPLRSVASSRQARRQLHHASRGSRSRRTAHAT